MRGDLRVGILEPVQRCSELNAELRPSSGAMDDDALRVQGGVRQIIRMRPGLDDLGWGPGRYAGGSALATISLARR